MRGHPDDIAGIAPGNVARKVARRGLVGAGAALGATFAAGGARVARPARAQASPAGASARPLDTELRRRAQGVREACARRMGETPVAAHPTNDDERIYPTCIGSDTRGLPHDARGEVQPAAWQALMQACRTGDPADFDRIPLGGMRRLGNPVGTMAVSLGGVTPTQVSMPAAPALASAERGAEAAEVYWQALLRDVPLGEFRDDTSHPDLRAAAAEMSRMQGFRGAPAGGQVTPGTLFRGGVLYVDEANPSGRAVIPPGVLEGPLVSQFLLRDMPFGAQWASARMRTVTPASEFLKDYDEWLAIQNGGPVRGRLQFDPTPRYISTGRDLAEAARLGPTLAWSTAIQLLLTPSSTPDPQYGGMFPVSEPALTPANPYRRSPNQSPGAATFGPQHVQAVLGLAVNFGPRAAYWQKWFVHRTLRPEAFGGLVHQRVANRLTDYPIHDDFLRSDALGRTLAKQGTALLSQTAPEGAPLFSAYPGGAASLAGAASTVLKAFFDESRVIANPVQPDPRDPTRLIPYAGPPLTVGGEINKLAMNMAMGRNWMGIHWWSDAAASLALGEAVALSLLRDERDTYKEEFSGFALTRFDGTPVTV